MPQIAHRWLTEHGAKSGISRCLRCGVIRARTDLSGITAQLIKDQITYQANDALRKSIIGAFGHWVYSHPGYYRIQSTGAYSAVWTKMHWNCQ